jgi:hypothetical protein
MEGVAIPEQLPHQLVDISQWATNDDYGAFPIGSKPKRSVICPDNPIFPFLVPSHAYLFKGAVGWRAQQMWSEIIAYRLSGLCGVDVPPCFAAIDGGQPGVLMEFFYGYPDEKPARRLIHGTDLIQRHLGDRYNTTTGRPHSLIRNLGACRALKVPDPLEWWAKAMAFDVLIGNTDRHAQNWGVLRQADGYVMAPAFDNGTSLGYMVTDDKLAMSDEELKRHIAAGRHHVTWEEAEGKHGDGAFFLCENLCTAQRRAREVIGRLLPVPDAPISEILGPLTRFDCPARFIPERAVLVERLIRARRDALAAILGL